MDVPAPTDDVDLTLRHVTRLFPEQLARALLPPGAAVAVTGWLDTQVTSRQRRLDRALSVTVNDETRLLHNEWEFIMRADVPFRVFEYHALLALAVAGEAPPGTSPPPIESTVVLFSGREAPWPAEGEYRTSPPDAPFCGVRFRIEAVYQRTVDELLVRPGLLWSIFTPLARDATPERMAQVVDRLRAETSPREFAELAAALVVMADADKRHRDLRGAIVSMVGKEIIMENWLYKQGLEKGLEKGRLVQARSALYRVFGNRNLPLTEEEKARIEACTDLTTLERWHDMAVVALTAAEALK